MIANGHHARYYLGPVDVDSTHRFVMAVTYHRARADRNPRAQLPDGMHCHADQAPWPGGRGPRWHRAAVQLTVSPKLLRRVLRSEEKPCRES